MSQSKNDWTIVQIIYRDPCQVTPEHPLGWKSRIEKYVVETPLRTEAERIIRLWLDEYPQRRTYLHEIHYYPRNYVHEARDLYAQGKVIS